MIKWNKVTWYSKLGAIIFFIAVLPAWTFYLGMYYEKTIDLLAGPSPTDKPQMRGEYGYRCGDGSEFTLVPSEDMETIGMIPATSVDVVPKATLRKQAGTPGVRYSANGVTLTIIGNSMSLSMNGRTTPCHPMDGSAGRLQFGS